MTDWKWPDGGAVTPPLPGKVGKGFRSVSEFGPRTPIYTPGGTTGSFHTGIDLVGFTMIRAVHAGVVTHVGSSASDGTAVHVDHGDGTSSEYIHMVAGSPTVSKGDRVSAGQGLGTVGMTGIAQGPHLHLRIKVAGRIVDPRPFLVARVSSGGFSGGGNTNPIPQEDVMAHAVVNEEAGSAHFAFIALVSESGKLHIVDPANRGWWDNYANCYSPKLPAKSVNEAEYQTFAAANQPPAQTVVSDPALLEAIKKLAFPTKVSFDIPVTTGTLS